jgi:hypothetical protein
MSEGVQDGISRPLHQSNHGRPPMCLVIVREAFGLDVSGPSDNLVRRKGDIIRFSSRSLESGRSSISSAWSVDRAKYIDCHLAEEQLVNSLSSTCFPQPQSFSKSSKTSYLSRLYQDTLATSHHGSSRNSHRKIERWHQGKYSSLNFVRGASGLMIFRSRLIHPATTTPLKKAPVPSPTILWPRSHHEPVVLSLRTGIVNR